MSFGSGSGFSFGQTNKTTAATGSPFSFSSTATPAAGTTQPSGGLSFGAAASQKPASGFSLGAPPAQSGFSFNAPASQTAATSSFGIGQTTSKPVGTATGLPFGATSTPQAGNPLGFNFGGAGQSTAVPASGFSLSAGTKPSNGFSFSSPAPAATAASTLAGTTNASGGGFPASGFKLGSQTTTAVDSGKPPAGGLSFQLGTPASSTATNPSAGFNLGTPQVTPAATTVPSTGGGGGLQLGASSGFQLGGQTGGFQLGGTAPQKKTTMTAATTASGGLSLGGGAGGFQLGAQTTAAATSASTLTGGLSLGLGKPASSATGFSLPSTSQPAGSSTTGGLTLGKPATTSVGNPLLGGLLTSTTAAAMTTTSAAVKPTLSFGGLTGSSSTATSSGVPTTTSTMTYRQLEQSINKWTVELEEQEKIFLQQASEVNNWDKILIHNGEKITALHNDMEKVKADQKRLSHELDYVVAQQRELEDMLIPLEESVRNTEGATYTQHTDLERERTYQMAETVDSQLKRMVQDLKEIIEHMNTVNTPRDSTDPLAQIAKILNAHMNSLQWIDQTTNSLQGKVEDVSRIYELVKRDQERNVHLAFD
ncbi:uncharacterized protein [Apostichopus japonicus]|uniref:uncharacterized protein isoform X3 n=1 Tax=Stichopus japonicus TaxID=307972 RepID=UPI003AB6BF58